jgi:hypothetical protein
LAAEATCTSIAGRLASSCGGASLTGSTKVLLASGLAIPIAGLNPGELVLATNTHTGKTSAESVTAVLLRHDTDRYDLTIKTGSGTAVIHTTRSHLFWDRDTQRWVKAGALKYGTHLRTPGSVSAQTTCAWCNASKGRGHVIPGEPAAGV